MSEHLFEEIEKGTRKGQMKKNIINFIMSNGATTITDIAKDMDLSVPTVTKFIDELSSEGFVCQNGKLETSGGRHPALYELQDDSCYFVGVEVNRFETNIGLMNFKGEIIEMDLGIPVNITNTPESLDKICKAIKAFIKKCNVNPKKILNVNVNLSGRVNPDSGYCYSIFYFEERPIASTISEKIGFHATIDNDTRAMAYGEYTRGAAKGEKDVLFVNVGWGLGLGIIINGKPYKGRSGFSGEFGHNCLYDNEVLCHCGKKGCLETEVSISALFRKLRERLNNGENSVLLKNKKSIDELTFEDFVEAVKKEDMFCIELIEEMGEQLGKHMAGLINIFNPELVIIGGLLSCTGDYLIQPIKTAIRKYTLNLMNRDSLIVESKLKEKAGVVGSCMMARRRIFED